MACQLIWSIQSGGADEILTKVDPLSDLTALFKQMYVCMPFKQNTDLEKNYDDTVLTIVKYNTEEGLVQTSAL